MNDLLFEYRGGLYPDYLKRGNAMQWIEPVAKYFCRGRGLDIGSGKWPLAGATPVDKTGGGIRHDGVSATDLPLGPVGGWDYLFSSHCLEHLENPIYALEHWQTRLRAHGVLMLYLPHPEMEYWQPQFCRKHLHIWQPFEAVNILNDLGFIDVIHSERDLAWSFAVVGWKP